MPSSTPRIRDSAAADLDRAGSPGEAAEQLLGPGAPFELAVEDRAGYAVRGVHPAADFGRRGAHTPGPIAMGTVRISSFRSGH